MEETRKALVNAIIDLAGDEFETMDELKGLATEDIHSLVDRIIHIAEYYREQYHSAVWMD
jgi:hypothetical protein